MLLYWNYREIFFSFFWIFQPSQLTTCHRPCFVYSLVLVHAAFGIKSASPNPAARLAPPCSLSPPCSPSSGGRFGCCLHPHTCLASIPHCLCWANAFQPPDLVQISRLYGTENFRKKWSVPSKGTQHWLNIWPPPFGTTCWKTDVRKY